MYVPYLRGKQFELLALRELAGQMSTSIMPLIEPVTPNLGAMERCVAALSPHGVRMAVAINPVAGEINHVSGTETICTWLATLEAPLRDGLLVPAVLVTDDDHWHSTIEVLDDRLGPTQKFVAVHWQNNPSFLAALDSTMLDRVVFHLIDPDTPTRRLHPIDIRSTGIKLHDRFDRAARNADYLDRVESEFGDDAYFYAEDGFAGFADFATIGRAFAAGGFRPRAVAIHWTFPKPASSDIPTILIRSFTSDSNDDYADVPGKFEQAGAKFRRWWESADRSQQTPAGEMLLQYIDDERFPGLGVLKKLSIMNHLQIMSRILAG
jgi:hypothetical protein